MPCILAAILASIILNLLDRDEIQYSILLEWLQDRSVTVISHYILEVCVRTCFLKTHQATFYAVFG